ncbi:polyketide cyclase [Pedobacter lusitanus]|uniref:Contig36, whole genome shotgun sequence n=1 Tax=Pedobacter lusitanus TaxID=1503925 RepID=A0A0D0F722_9SPHI|nr:SRPBCC family protein [Pedobacter lusitanus]KIO77378.1 polyketide cyclase [Pedobacter lusitanus]
METVNNTSVTIETTVNAPIEKVWESWNKPEHITKWSHASDDWHTTYADNDLRKDGKFKTTMAAKDGSLSFDFEGVYTSVIEQELIAYTMGDGRKVKISFVSNGDGTQVIETFDPESTNPVEMQRGGWQAILDNFKKYTEANL